MTITELRRAVHTAYYRIVRQREPLGLQAFLGSTLEDIWPGGPTPSGWADFWWESVAVEIQNSVMARGEYILEFDYQWLKEQKSVSWEAVIDAIGEDLVPLAIPS